MSTVSTEFSLPQQALVPISDWTGPCNVTVQPVAGAGPKVKVTGFRVGQYSLGDGLPDNLGGLYVPIENDAAPGRRLATRR